MFRYTVKYSFIPNASTTNWILILGSVGVFAYDEYSTLCCFILILIVMTIARHIKMIIISSFIRVINFILMLYYRIIVRHVIEKRQTFYLDLSIKSQKVEEYLIPLLLNDCLRRSS